MNRTTFNALLEEFMVLKAAIKVLFQEEPWFLFCQPFKKRN
jgi:hypothetical protein